MRNSKENVYLFKASLKIGKSRVLLNTVSTFNFFGSKASHKKLHAYFPVKY